MSVYFTKHRLEKQRKLAEEVAKREKEIKRKPEVEVAEESVVNEGNVSEEPEIETRSRRNKR